MSKHVSKSLEWHQIVPLACATYNFLPNKHSNEDPVFLMFGRKAIDPLNTPLKPTAVYLGTDENILSLYTFKNMHQIVTTNLRVPRKRVIPKAPPTNKKLKE